MQNSASNNVEGVDDGEGVDDDEGDEDGEGAASQQEKTEQVKLLS